MLEPSSDAKRSAYSREDDSARRLWLTQRTKVNPWEHRTPEGEDEQAERPPAPAPRGTGPLPTLIGQQDRLNLQTRDAGRVENPFETLVVNRILAGDQGKA